MQNLNAHAQNARTHYVQFELGAMLINIAFVYNSNTQEWGAHVANVVDDDGNDEWDANAFNTLVLNSFVSYNANATAQHLAQQLTTLVQHLEPGLHFEVF